MRELTPLRLPIQRLDPGLALPAYARPGDAGLDLHSREDVTIAPGHRVLVGTGIAVQIPAGWVGLVHPRSGLAARHGVSIVNAPGTIDSGFRGEILVNLINLDPEVLVHITRGDRIAQLLLQEVAEVELVETDVLSTSQRGETGHGSTGGHIALAGEPVIAACPLPTQMSGRTGG